MKQTERRQNPSKLVGRPHRGLKPNRTARRGANINKEKKNTGVHFSETVGVCQIDGDDCDGKAIVRKACRHGPKLDKGDNITCSECESFGSQHKLIDRQLREAGNSETAVANVLRYYA